MTYFWIRIEKSRVIFFGHCTYREVQIKNDEYEKTPHILIDLKGGKIERQRLDCWYNQNDIPEANREGIKNLIINELKDKGFIQP